MFIVNNSNAEIMGNALLEDNSNIGLSINTSSSATIFMPASITVRGTQGGYGTGIFLCDNSVLRSFATLLVENNGNGSLNCGIYACRNATATMFPDSSTDVKIQNNVSYGIAIHLNSVGRFQGNVNVSGNTDHGVRLLQSSLIDASGIGISPNQGAGISATDGSSVRCFNCTITGNVNNDVRLEWASRSFLIGGTVGSVICEDNTVLTAGDYVCP
jgi:hypothetical protein